MQLNAFPVEQHFVINGQDLGAIKALAKHDRKAANKAVAQQFEALFVAMLLKSMRQASPQFDELRSHSTELFRQIHDQQLSYHLGKQRSLGLAKMINQQLNRLSSPQESPHQVKPSASIYPTIAAKTAAADIAQSPQHFVSHLWQPATTAARRLGVAEHLILAQAALESGWGKRLISREDGTNSHNLFGVKAGEDWQGDTVDIVTSEYVDGRLQKRRERFRSYDSYQAAFDDYASLLLRRFKAATYSGNDSQRFAQALQADGYATDPRYADKLMQIAEQLRQQWHHDKQG